MNTAQAAHAAGITTNQADRWARNGITTTKLGGNGSGHPRWWNHQDVACLTLVAALLHAGLDTTNTAHATHLARQLTNWDDQILVIGNNGPDLWPTEQATEGIYWADSHITHIANLDRIHRHLR